jgi:putative ABC transport system permease protein
LFSAAFGSILYRVILAFALRIDMFPAYALKLISAVIVIIALAGPSVKSVWQQYKFRREAGSQIDNG